jgi:hypothetical protein
MSKNLKQWEIIERNENASWGIHQQLLNLQVILVEQVIEI